MAFTPVEIIALMLIAITIIKLLVLSTNPKKWLSLVEGLYANANTTKVIALILAAIVFYYLLQEITIVQIFATMAFIFLIMAIKFASYKNDIIALARKILNKEGVIKKSGLLVVIWLLLMIWALYAIFG